jgi:hypothetical protein
MNYSQNGSVSNESRVNGQHTDPVILEATPMGCLELRLAIVGLY